MAIRLGVVMDPIESINPKKDSTLAMLLAAQRQDWELYYMQRTDLLYNNGQTFASMRRLQVQDNLQTWFTYLSAAELRPLAELDVILMRVDPPYNMNYVHATFLLQQAATEGVLVVNRPESLRLINEKLFILQFQQFCAPTLVTAQPVELRQFLQQQQAIVVKPLDAMGGQGIFRLELGDLNTNAILETITQSGQTMVMAQQFIPEISAGDKRILVVAGEPIPYALARIPKVGEFRGNLAAGGRGVGQPLTERDWQIARTVGAVLRDMGVLFAGLDVIGDYLTEINVTSPTCIRELDQQYQLDIAGELMHCIKKRLGERTNTN